MPFGDKQEKLSKQVNWPETGSDEKYQEFGISYIIKCKYIYKQRNAKSKQNSFKSVIVMFVVIFFFN